MKSKTQRVKRDPNAAARAALAISLYAQHLSYDEIAARAGYASRGAAYNAIQRELDRTLNDAADDARRQMTLMIDTLIADVYELATDKANKGRLFAVDRLLALAERKAKLLGLDVQRENTIAAAQVVIRRYDADTDAL